jgi:hypothetical protein
MEVAILLIQATTVVDTTLIEAQTIIETIIAQILIEAQTIIETIIAQILMEEVLLITSLEGQILDIQEITNLNIILIIEIILILQDIDKTMILETFNQVVIITNRVDF